VDSTPTTFTESKGVIVRLRDAIKAALEYPFLAWRYRDLLGSFVWRDLRARYEGSFLGRVWPILQPAILISVYYLVFVTFLGMAGRGSGEAIPGISEKSYAGFELIAGVLPWLAFSQAILRCTNVVIEHASMIKRIAFPSELLAAYVVTLETIYFLLALLVYIPVMWFIVGWVPLRLLYLPLAILLQMVFTIGLGLFLGALNVFLRDTSQFIGLVLMLWMFLTPIFYPEEIPRRQLGEYFYLIELNPIYHLVRIYRALMLRYTDPFPWFSILKFSFFAFPTFLIGLTFYRSTKGRFADEV
jgi:ABC-type polysaccharide/polyol phosphate export permease